MFQRLRHAIISLKLARYLVYSRLITRIWLLSEFEIWHFHVLCVVSIFKLLISCKRNPSSTTKVQTYYPMEETRAWSSQTLPANLSFHIFHFVRTNYNFQSNSTERLISFEIKVETHPHPYFVKSSIFFLLYPSFKSLMLILIYSHISQIRDISNTRKHILILIL